MIVVGNLVGVDAPTAVAAVLPVTVGAQFVSRLAFCGAGAVSYVSDADSPGSNPRWSPFEADRLPMILV